MTIYNQFFCSMSSSNYCFLTCIQISQKAGKVVWYSHLFKNFPQFVVIHKAKGFSLVSEAELDVFLEFPSFLYETAEFLNLISGSSAFSKSNLYIWKFSVHVLLKSNLKDFEHYLASVWNEHSSGGSLNILWHCPSLGLEWKLNSFSACGNPHDPHTSDSQRKTELLL